LDPSKYKERWRTEQLLQAQELHSPEQQLQVQGDMVMLVWVGIETEVDSSLFGRVAWEIAGRG
jgi:hypothetical protein